MTALAHALSYARRGWPVLPIAPGTKIPAGGNGIDHATTDQAQIERWFKHQPDAGIGIRLDRAGLVAVDIDPRNGGDLELMADLPITLTAQTGGGGRHLIYRAAPGAQYPGQLRAGVDLKHRGYIIVEPSVHPRGGTYSWIDWDPLEGEQPEIAEAPDELLKPRVNGSHHASQALVEAGGRVPVGGRNAYLSRRAYALRKAGASLEGIEAELLRINAESCTPPLSADEVRAIARGKHSVEPEQLELGVPFTRVPIADLYDVTPPAPEHVWQDYIPRGVVTLFGAHGGFGKSTLALLLAVCTALGVPCLGVPTKRCIVVFYSAEDGAEILRHRLHWICKALGIDPRSLDGWLHILDATGGDPTLYTEVNAGGVRVGRTTPAYEELSELVRELGAGLLIVDNASDTYAASEIDRARVREFMRSLGRIARDNSAGVMLLAHINKVKARGLDGSAESYSGSTAWHNSARSRLALDRTDDGLVLKHEKANLGPMRKPLEIAWPQGGVMHVIEEPTGMMAVIVDRNETKALLRLIHEFTERGEFVSTATTSRTHAGKLLGREPNYPKGLDDARLFDLLRTAERKGLLARETYRGADRKTRERWQVTPQGLEQAGVAATAATCATTDVTASGASRAEPAATAATSPLGGVGEERAHKSPQTEELQ